MQKLCSRDNVLLDPHTHFCEDLQYDIMNYSTEDV